MSMLLQLRSTWLSLSFCLIISSLLAGCFMITDGATRLAYDIESGASKLHNSNQERIEVVHRPRSTPDGVRGPYEIMLQYSLEHPKKGGTLVVAGLDDQGSRVQGSVWTTSYHLNFVRVPQDLVIRKAKHAPTVIVLHKVGDAIEVESLR